MSHSFDILTPAVTSALLSICFLVGISSHAQSDPGGFGTVINVPSDRPQIFDGEEFQEDTQINLREGGTIGSGVFIGTNSARGPVFSELNVYGGSVGRNLRTDFKGQVNVFGGQIGDNVRVGPFAILNVNGGTLGDNMAITFEGTLNLRGGSIGDDLSATRQTYINISGGQVGDDFFSESNYLVSITGGQIGDRFRSGGATSIAGGGFGQGFDGSRLELIGDRYRLNGQVYVADTITLGDGDVFTGIFRDGRPFIFTDHADDRLAAVRLTKQGVAPSTNPDVVLGPDSPTYRNGLRPGESVTALAGGRIGNDFQVLEGRLVLQGGTAGENLEIVQGEMLIEDGSLVSTFQSYDSAVVMSGGRIQGLSSFREQSEVKISGGVVERRLRVEDESRLTTTGGRFEDAVSLTGQGTHRINGGDFRNSLSFGDVSQSVVSGGTFSGRFFNNAGSKVSLVGGEFRLNNAAYSADQINLLNGSASLFTGTLADGSIAIFDSFSADFLDNVRLERQPLAPRQTTPYVFRSAGDADAFRGLRSGEQLILQENGQINRSFAAANADLQIHGGFIDGHVQTAYSSTAITDGLIEGRLELRGDATLQMTGGRIRDSILLFNDAYASISGGDTGEFFAAYGNSQLDLIGTSFSIDGEPITGLTIGEATEITQRSVVLSGVLADGTPFSYGLRPFFSCGCHSQLSSILQSGATLNVVLVPEPAYGYLILSAVVLISLRRRNLLSTGGSAAS